MATYERGEHGPNGTPLSSGSATVRGVIRSGRVIVGLLLLPLALPVSGQQVPEVGVGERVLIWVARQGPELDDWPPPQSVRGRVLRMSTDSVTVEFNPGAMPLQMSWSAVERMFVSRGVQSRVGSALRRGTASGLSLGVTFLIIEWLRKDSDWQAAWVATGVGALVYAVYGALSPGEIWDRVR